MRFNLFYFVFFLSDPFWGLFFLFLYKNKTMDKPTDLYQDMQTLNSLYEELMWDTTDALEFVADYENDRIIIRNKTRQA